MEVTESTGRPDIGIAEMATRSGLSVDTLRWYEKEGMVPAVSRGTDGRRRYTAQEQGIVMLLARLRRTGMPAALMKEFALLVTEGAASHGRRIAVLQQTREILEERRAAVDAAITSLDEKVAHYQHLIDAGLDCDGAPVPSDLRARQRAHHLNIKESA